MTNVTVERVKKLETLGNELKKSMAQSLDREAPVIIYHPSRLPNAEEFRQLFSVSTGQAVEHDIRAGKEGYSIQQGMFTDRMKAWTVVPVSDLKVLGEILGTARTAEIVEVIKSRDKSGKPFSMDTVKSNLFVKDMTYPELKRLGEAGGEEILSLGQFLDLYQQAAAGTVKPGKLSIDVKDGDESVSGGVELAVNATKAIFDELNARGLEGSAYMVMQYSIPAYTRSREIFGSVAISACALPSDIIKKRGEDEFRNYAGRVVNDAGAEWMVSKIGELALIKDLLRSDAGKEAPRMMVYVPPKESTDTQLLVQTLRDYPNIKALQIDA